MRVQSPAGRRLFCSVIVTLTIRCCPLWWGGEEERKKRRKRKKKGRKKLIRTHCWLWRKLLITQMKLQYLPSIASANQSESRTRISDTAWRKNCEAKLWGNHCLGVIAMKKGFRYCIAWRMDHEDITVPVLSRRALGTSSHGGWITRRFPCLRFSLGVGEEREISAMHY